MSLPMRHNHVAARFYRAFYNWTVLTTSAHQHRSLLHSALSAKRAIRHNSFGATDNAIAYNVFQSGQTEIRRKSAESRDDWATAAPVPSAQRPFDALEPWEDALRYRSRAGLMVQTAVPVSRVEQLEAIYGEGLVDMCEKLFGPGGARAETGNRAVKEVDGEEIELRSVLYSGSLEQVRKIRKQLGQSDEEDQRKLRAEANREGREVMEGQKEGHQAQGSFKRPVTFARGTITATPTSDFSGQDTLPQEGRGDGISPTMKHSDFKKLGPIDHIRYISPRMQPQPNPSRPPTPSFLLMPPKPSTSIPSSQLRLLEPTLRSRSKDLKVANVEIVIPANETWDTEIANVVSASQQTGLGATNLLMGPFEYIDPASGETVWRRSLVTEGVAGDVGEVVRLVEEARARITSVARQNTVAKYTARLVHKSRDRATGDSKRKPVAQSAAPRHRVKTEAKAYESKKETESEKGSDMRPIMIQKHGPYTPKSDKRAQARREKRSEQYLENRDMYAYAGEVEILIEDYRYVQRRLARVEDECDVFIQRHRKSGEAFVWLIHSHSEKQLETARQIVEGLVRESQDFNEAKKQAASDRDQAVSESTISRNLDSPDANLHGKIASPSTAPEPETSADLRNVATASASASNLPSDNSPLERKIAFPEHLRDSILPHIAQVKATSHCRITVDPWKRHEVMLSLKAPSQVALVNAENQIAELLNRGFQSGDFDHKKQSKFKSTPRIVHFDIFYARMAVPNEFKKLFLEKEYDLYKTTGCTMHFKKRSTELRDHEKTIFLDLECYSRDGLVAGQKGICELLASHLASHDDRRNASSLAVLVDEGNARRYCVMSASSKIENAQRTLRSDNRLYNLRLIRAKMTTKLFCFCEIAMPKVIAQRLLGALRFLWQRRRAHLEFVGERDSGTSWVLSLETEDYQRLDRAVEATKSQISYLMKDLRIEGEGMKVMNRGEWKTPVIRDGAESLVNASGEEEVITGAAGPISDDAELRDSSDVVSNNTSDLEANQKQYEQLFPEFSSLGSSVVSADNTTTTTEFERSSTSLSHMVASPVRTEGAMQMRAYSTSSRLVTSGQSGLAADAAESLKRALRTLTHPVVLVTSSSSEAAERNSHVNYRGVTVSSFTTVTMDPPVVSFNLKVPSRSWDAISSSESFLVHFLAANEGGAAIALAFTQPYESPNEPFMRLEKLGVTVKPGPKLQWNDAVIGIIEATLIQEKAVTLGDHVVAFANVDRVEVADFVNDEVEGLAYAMKGFRGAGNAVKPVDLPELSHQEKEKLKDAVNRGASAEREISSKIDPASRTDRPHLAASSRRAYSSLTRTRRNRYSTSRSSAPTTPQEADRAEGAAVSPVSSVANPEILSATVGEFLGIIDNKPLPRIHRLMQLRREAEHASQRLQHALRKGSLTPEESAQLENVVSRNERHIAKALALRSADDLRRMLDTGRVDFKRTQWLESSVEKGQAVLLEEAKQLRGLLDEKKITTEQFNVVKAKLEEQNQVLTAEAVRLRQLVDEEGEGGGRGFDGFEGNV